MEKFDILIVEDERIVALSIKSILLSEGYRVCKIASSSQQALRAIVDYKPKIVLMDIKIKGKEDGVSLAKKIWRKYKIPSIFLTAYSDQELLNRAKIAEPLGYILKPFKSSDILSAVKVALYRSSQEEKRFSFNKELKNKLSQNTETLKKEVFFRKKIENDLCKKTSYLEEANKALNLLLETRRAEQRAYEEYTIVNIRKIVIPYVEMIRSQTSDSKILQTVQLLEDALNNSIAQKSKKLFVKYQDLTPQEIKIADLVRQGKRTKEIAQMLNLASSSVSTHRYNIRKKLGLLNSSTNLESYLNSFEI